jgi:hypothetical protein
MPEPDLDEVDRKIKEAKELAHEVEQPDVRPDETAPPQPVHEESEGGFTPS